MEKHNEYYFKAKRMGKKTISYSQFNMYSQCPKHWELQYIKKLGKWDPTIYNVFGQAMKRLTVNNHRATVQLNDLANGQYYIQVLQKNGTVVTQQFVKVD